MALFTPKEVNDYLEKLRAEDPERFTAIAQESSRAMADTLDFFNAYECGVGN